MPSSPRSWGSTATTGSPPAPALVDTYLRSVCSAARRLRRPVHAPDPGEVGAGRPLEAPADPGLEPRLPPLLAGQDADPIEPAGARSLGSPLYVLYLRALGAQIGRGVTIFSRARAGVHRPAHHRRRARSSARTRSSPATARTPALIQTGPVTLGRDVFVGEATVLDIGPRWATGPSSATPRRCTPARRCRPASAGTARPRSRPRWTTARSIPPTAALCDAPPTPSSQLLQIVLSSTCRSSLGAVAIAVRRSSRGCATSAWDSPGLHAAGRSTSTLSRPSPSSSSAACSSASLVVVHRAAAAQPGDQARQGLSAVRLPLLGPPDDRAHDQQQVLHRALRRQLLHRPLPARPRLRPVTGRADRLELRHGGQAREPVPELGRQRHGGRRRAVDRQRRLLEHVLPGVPGVDRGAQLPRQHIAYPAQGRTGDDCLLATKVMVPIDGPVRRGRRACSARPASRSRGRSSATAGSTS